MICRAKLTQLTAFLLCGHPYLHRDSAPGRCFQWAAHSGVLLSHHLSTSGSFCGRITVPLHLSYGCQLNIVPSLAFGHRPFCGACLVFISVSVRDPGLKLLEVQMTSGFSAPPEYWLQCLSVHYSSKLMMQSTTCCLQLSVRVERSWQKCLVFCEQHVINSLGACSLYVDDYSLRYVFFIFLGSLYYQLCTIFLSLLLIPALIEQKGQPFVQ